MICRLFYCFDRNSFGLHFQAQIAESKIPTWFIKSAGESSNGSQVAYRIIRQPPFSGSAQAEPVERDGRVYRGRVLLFSNEYVCLHGLWFCQTRCSHSVKIKNPVQKNAHPSYRQGIPNSLVLKLTRRLQNKSENILLDFYVSPWAKVQYFSISPEKDVFQLRQELLLTE